MMTKFLRVQNTKKKKTCPGKGAPVSEYEFPKWGGMLRKINGVSNFRTLEKDDLHDWACDTPLDVVIWLNRSLEKCV